MDMIRLIASDLDATLLDGQSQLPPDFAETVGAGHPVRCRQRTAYLYLRGDVRAPAGRHHLCG
mgnify:CR=1 FL=1